MRGELQESFDCIIEYMLEIGGSNELFEVIYEGMVKVSYRGQE